MAYLGNNKFEWVDFKELIYTNNTYIAVGNNYYGITSD